MNKKQLYESIMSNVAKLVKKALNENEASPMLQLEEIKKYMQRFTPCYSMDEDSVEDWFDKAENNNAILMTIANILGIQLPKPSADDFRSILDVIEYFDNNISLLSYLDDELNNELSRYLDERMLTFELPEFDVDNKIEILHGTKDPEFAGDAATANWRKNYVAFLDYLENNCTDYGSGTAGYKYIDYEFALDEFDPDEAYDILIMLNELCKGIVM